MTLTHVWMDGKTWFWSVLPEERSVRLWLTDCTVTITVN